VKIHWITFSTVSAEGRASNENAIKALGLAEHRGSGPLAVVGGGPSVNAHVDEIKNAQTVWAANGAVNWCIDHGIDAWFYTCDAAPLANWFYDLSRVKRAVLAPDVSPELVQSLLSRGVEVQLCAPVESGPTSVNASTCIALSAGYCPVTYYGCEGSFSGVRVSPLQFRESATHAVESFPITDWLDVEVGGELYRTKAEFIEQSKFLALTLKEFPQAFFEKSGGLLRAMIEHGPEHDVVQVADSLYAKLTDVA
jgi:hypothetical protein